MGRWAALLLGLLAGPVAAAEAVRWEGTAFEMPDGWARPAPERAGLWQAQRVFGSGRERGSAAIQVLRPVPAGGDPAPLLAQAGRIIPELAGERPLGRGEGVTVNGHRIAHEARCCGRRGGVLLSTDAVAIADGRRGYVLMMVGIDLRGDAQRAARADFDGLVRSFRPGEADRAVGLVAPEGSGGLEGVYTHLSTGIRPNVFGGTDFYADNEVLLFDRGGLFSRAIPPGEEDVAAHCRARPAGCGTYRLLGGGVLRGPDRIELREVASRYGVIEVAEKPLAREGEDLRIGGEAYRRVPPLPAGTRFEGSWRYFFGAGGGGGFSSGSVSVERVLTLSRDGRFRRSGFSGASTSVEGGGSRTGVVAGRERPAEAGRYAVEGYRLVLVGEDGRRESLSLFQPDPGSDGLLIIGGGNYRRREGRK